MIALDSSKNVYVPNRADSFFVLDTMGNLLRTFVVPGWFHFIIAGNELYIDIPNSNINDSIVVYSLSGARIRSWLLCASNNCVLSLLADSNAIMAGNSCLGQVTIFDTSGSTLSTIGTAPFSSGIAYDRAKARLFVNNAQVNLLRVFDKNGNLLAQYQPSILQESPPGSIARDQNGFIYEIIPQGNEIVKMHCLLP